MTLKIITTALCIRGALFSFAQKTQSYSLASPEGVWEAEIFQDGINADRNATDYKKQ